MKNAFSRIGLLVASVFVFYGVSAQKTVPGLVYGSSDAVLNITVSDYQNYINSLDAQDRSDYVVVNYKKGVADELAADTVRFSNSGTATISLNLCYSKIVTLLFAENMAELLLVPGKTLDVTLDTSKADSENMPVWRCSGENARFNSDLANYGYDYDEIRIFADMMLMSPDNLKKMDADRYKKVILAIYERAMGVILTDNRLSSLFKDFLCSRFQIVSLGKLVECKQVLSRAKGVDVEEIRLPPDYWDILDLWSPFKGNGILYSSFMPELNNLAMMVSVASEQAVELPSSYRQLANARAFVGLLLKGHRLTSEEKASIHEICPDLEIALLDLESRIRK